MVRGSVATLIAGHRHQLCKTLKFITPFSTDTTNSVKDGVSDPIIAFVLGGPGSGKGTQCSRIAETFGFTHLSAGDLLREEMSSRSEISKMIHDIIKEGKIVPSEVTVNLLQKAIQSSESNKFLIDGFPRCDENRIAFEKIVGIEPEIVLFFDCPKEEMVRRILGRNQGRIDDTIDTAMKRISVFEKLSLPVLDYYAAKGKVTKIDAMGTADEIFEKVRPVFTSLSSSWK